MHVAMSRAEPDEIYYRKYEFPNQKLDMNGLSSRIYYSEIILILEFLSQAAINFKPTWSHIINVPGALFSETRNTYQ